MVLLSFAWSFSRVVVLFSFGAFFFDPWTDACEATWSGSTGGVFMADMTLGGFTRKRVCFRLSTVTISLTNGKPGVAILQPFYFPTNIRRSRMTILGQVTLGGRHS